MSRKLAYAFGSLGTALSFQFFINNVQFHYTVNVGVSAATLQIVWFFFGLWNALNDPLMGQLSDRTHSRLGRRIPYILFGALPLGVCFALIWSPPVAAGPVALLIYFAVLVFAFDTLWTLIVLAWTALFPEMWPDPVERASVSGWREVFSLIGVLIALGAGPILIDSLGWPMLGIIFGAVTAVSFLVSLLGSKERPREQIEEDTPSLWHSLKTSFAIPSFRWFLVANIAKEFIIVIVLAMLPFYATFALQLQDVPDGLSAADQLSAIQAIPFVLSIPAMFVWMRLTQRVGARRAWMFSSYVLIPGLLVMMVAPSFLVALIGSALLTLGLPGLLMLSNIVISDVIDEDEVIHGQRREGFFFGINGALIRLAFSVQAILVFLVFTSTGFDAQAVAQPIAAQWGLRFLLGGTPALAALVTVFALTRFPLHGDALTAMREKLGARNRHD